MITPWQRTSMTGLIISGFGLLAFLISTIFFAGSASLLLLLSWGSSFPTTGRGAKHQKIPSQWQIIFASFSSLTPNSIPLFTYHASGGHLSYKHAIAWLPMYNGHIGATTEFLVTGVLPYIVKAKGKWSSNSFHEIPLSQVWNLTATSRKYKRI